MSDELRINRRTLAFGVLAGVLILAIAAIYFVFMRPEAAASLPPATATSEPTDSPTDATTEPTPAEASPTELSFADQLLTAQGLFMVSYSPAAESIEINAMHEWTLHVETADGDPVEGADIRVDGGMPDHGHGLPTVPQVTEDLGGGDYRVEGVKFQMPGWWVVMFEITADGQTDTVTFNLRLN